MTEQPDNAWPSWRYGPEGQSGVFHKEEDVPEGWVDHISKLGAEPEKPAKLTAAEKKAAKEAAEKEAAEKEAAEKAAPDKPDAPVTEGDF